MSIQLPSEVPETYEELVRLYLPRPIHNEVQSRKATEICDWLCVRAANRDQLDYLEVLCEQLFKHEGLTDDMRCSSPLETLNYLVDENGITSRELGQILGVDHSVAARMLKGERSITVKHAKALGTRFKLAPVAFLDL